MTSLHNMSAWALLCSALILAVAFTCAGRLVLRRVISNADFFQNNDVAGVIVAVVGTIYAVLLAFVTAIVWQEYDATQQRVAREAAACANAWHLASAVPNPLGRRLSDAMVQYAHVMVDQEWPAMRIGADSPLSEQILTETIGWVASAAPRDAGQANLQAALLRDLTEMHTDRRARLADNVAAISPFQWAVLAIGALALLAFCYLMGGKNEHVMMFMTGAMVCVVVSVWVLIFELDLPFRGDLGIEPTYWTMFLTRVASG